MQFQVNRVSDYRRDTPPVEGAYTIEPPWPNKDMKCWCIDISSLEDLIKLSDKEKEQLIVAGPSYDGYSFPSITVYDDWYE